MTIRSIPAFRNPVQAVAENVQSILDSLPALGWVRTVVCVAVSLLLVALIYLAQFSNAAILARSLRVKQQHIIELQQENAQLEFDVAAATSPSSIEARARKLDLGPAQNIVYADLPPLQPDRAAPIPSVPPPPLPAATAAVPTLWDQILSLLNLGRLNDTVQAKGNYSSSRFNVRGLQEPARCQHYRPYSHPAASRSCSRCS